VVSSYAPTIRVLRHARGHAESAEPRALVVALPHTPSLPHAELPSAEEEARIVGDSFASHAEVLLGPAATPGRVRAALSRHTCVHFACHAATDPADPSMSSFTLHNGRITVADLMRMDLTRAHLAYLSACETARTDGPLLDEASHLASACQVAGYPHVIATLWPVRDRIAAESARHIYTGLPAGRGDVATVVNSNARRIRARRPGRPELWASHIHLGP
jgi:CHAT domain-containing protein